MRRPGEPRGGVWTGSEVLVGMAAIILYGITWQGCWTLALGFRASACVLEGEYVEV